jgi:outer membrane receptor protein involved in Fe transport
MRHFGEYPLVEDNSVRAEPATLFNAELGYRLPSGLRLQATLLNVLDAEAYDIQYFYESRLPGEPASGVEDIHFHPVEPRQLRFTVHWEF